MYQVIMQERQFDDFESLTDALDYAAFVSKYYQTGAIVIDEDGVIVKTFNCRVIEEI